MFVIRVYKRDGTPIAELERIAECKRTWALNKYGTATFKVPISHPKATRDILARDNRVIIWSDIPGLEPWAGYITARDWDKTSISVTCNGIAGLLDSRRRIEDANYTNAFPYQIFTGVLNQANAIENSGILPGNVYIGGVTQELKGTGETPYKLIQTLLTQSGFDWDTTLVRPGLWLANLYEKKGDDKTDTVMLSVGQEIMQKPRYTEDESKLCNYCIAYGKTPDGGGARPRVVALNQASIDAHGLAMDTIEFSDITDLPTLQAHADAEVEKRKDILRTLSLSIHNKRGYFGQITDGDIVIVDIPNYAFTGLRVPIKVLGRELEEAKGSMALVAEVVNEGDAQLLKRQFGEDL